jgi:peptidoglycan/xylan/chitin deacetylase (PgdA/CDA1 family)/phosphotransferase system HPr-like phosphotransfer protein
VIRTVVGLLLALVVAGWAKAQSASPPIDVVLWFDTEDYILPQDDEATKRLAETLTRLGVRATFKIVGEKARVLEQRGRRDVIAALQAHDIGYHSNTHSQQPTIAVYLQNAGWEDGRAEFFRREVQGVRDIQRIFGVTPVAYGQPGSAWAPQAYPALRDMGIGMYLDESDHVGIDDQPFFYGGMLNVFKMRSNLARMALSGGASLAKGEAAFATIAERLRAQGGGTISIYYHPNEWVQTEFWDAVNFRRGANPARAEWKLPGTRPAAETEQAFQDFEAYVRFIKGQPGVRFVTATELMKIYADAAMTRSFGPEDFRQFARSVQKEITFQRLDGYAVSAADIFGLLTEAMREYVERNEWPGAATVRALDGPARPYTAPSSSTRSSSFSWNTFARAVRETSDYCRSSHRVPDEIWVGAESLSPSDYLATLARAVEDAMASGNRPTDVVRREGRYTADRYVAEDSPDLWSWPIFPEGFHAPRIMELAQLQAWTLKPATMRR